MSFVMLGDRARIGRAMTSEHGAVVSHEVPGGSRDLRLGGSSAGARGEEDVASAATRATTASGALRISGRQCTGRAYQPAAAHTEAESCCASAPAAARQSASLSRYA